jgi:hypothetical protein
MEQRIPKRPHIKFRRREITQKKEFNRLRRSGCISFLVLPGVHYKACRDVKSDNVETDNVETDNQATCYYNNFLKIHKKNNNQVGAIYSGQETDGVGLRFTVPSATRLSMDMAMFCVTDSPVTQTMLLRTVSKLSLFLFSILLHENFLTGFPYILYSLLHYHASYIPIPSKPSEFRHQHNALLPIQITKFLLA